MSVLLTYLWPFVRKFWFILPIALLSAWAWRVDSLRAHYKADRDAVKAEYAAFETAIIDKTAEAMAKDKAKAKRVAAESQVKIQEAVNEAQKSRDAYLAVVADRFRVRDEAGQGSGGAEGVPAVPALSTGTLRPGHTALVDDRDANACTVNTLNLEGIIAAWNGVAAIDVNGGQ